MSDDLTNTQIALLCDIGEFNLPKQLTSDRKRDLEQLVSGGYVESTENNPKSKSTFMLTPKGLDFLGKRGAGLNEA
jgi:predicted transcriptional regulator